MTNQMPDKLTLNRSVRSVYGLPDLSKLVPHPLIEVLTDDEFAEGPHKQVIPSIIFSTACWRQYIAHWRIAEDRLYLRRIVGRYKLLSPKPLFADWVIAELVVPESHVIKRNSPASYRPVFTLERRIQVEKGLVISQEVGEGRLFRMPPHHPQS